MNLTFDRLRVGWNPSFGRCILDDATASPPEVAPFGSTLLMTRELARHFNFTLQYSYGFREWGNKLPLPNGTLRWNGLMGMLESGTADMVLCALTLTGERYTDSLFANRFDFSHIGFVTLQISNHLTDDPVTRTDLRMPYSWNIFPIYALTLAVLVVSLSSWKATGSVSDPPLYGRVNRFFHIVIHSLASWMRQSSRFWKNCSVLSYCWIVFSLFVGIFYGSSLISTITMMRYDADLIDSWDKLFKAATVEPILFLVYGSGYSYDSTVKYFNESGRGHLLRQILALREYFPAYFLSHPLRKERVHHFYVANIIDFQNIQNWIFENEWQIASASVDNAERGLIPRLFISPSGDSLGLAMDGFAFSRQSSHWFDRLNTAIGRSYDTGLAAHWLDATLRDIVAEKSERYRQFGQKNKLVRTFSALQDEHCNRNTQIGTIEIITVQTIRRLLFSYAILIGMDLIVILPWELLVKKLAKKSKSRKLFLVY